MERFIPNLFEEFFSALESINIPEKQIADFKDARLFCERFVEFVIDLLSALPTRRFFCLYLVDQHFIIRARLSELGKWSEQQSQAADRLFWHQIGIVIKHTSFMWSFEILSNFINGFQSIFKLENIWYFTFALKN